MPVSAQAYGDMLSRKLPTYCGRQDGRLRGAACNSVVRIR